MCTAARALPIHSLHAVHMQCAYSAPAVHVSCICGAPAVYMTCGGPTVYRCTLQVNLRWTCHVHGMCTACALRVHCLQVALARRQCWVRAFQLGPILGLLSYSTCVLVEAAGLVKLPRGSRTGVRTAAWP